MISPIKNQTDFNTVHLLRYSYAISAKIYIITTVIDMLTNKE